MLTGKVAIVTGGDSGIGHAISLELARQGASVTVNFHKNEAAADATIKEIEALGSKGQAVQADVSSVADIQAALVTEAQLIHDEDVASCKALGGFGATLVPNEATILTHCNAGALASEAMIGHRAAGSMHGSASRPAIARRIRRRSTIR